MSQHHVDPHFAATLTAAEAKWGFELGTIKTPLGTFADTLFGTVPECTAAAIRELGNGKKAVKILSAVTRSIEYAIYGANDRPCEHTALSLAELARRYP